LLLRQPLYAKFNIPHRLTRFEKRYLEADSLCAGLNRRAMFIRLQTMLGLVFTPQCLSERLAVNEEDVEQLPYSVPLEQIGL
jgi:hypothetical protein